MACCKRNPQRVENASSPVPRNKSIFSKNHTLKTPVPGKNTTEIPLAQRTILRRIRFLCIAAIAPFFLNGQEVFFFRDSNNPGYYDTGLAFKTTPSSIEQTGPSGDKIPTSSTAYFGIVS